MLHWAGCLRLRRPTAGRFRMPWETSTLYCQEGQRVVLVTRQAERLADLLKGHALDVDTGDAGSWTARAQALSP